MQEEQKNWEDEKEKWTERRAGGVGVEFGGGGRVGERGGGTEKECEKERECRGGGGGEASHPVAITHFPPMH